MSVLKLFAILCLAAAAAIPATVDPAAADDHPPTSLRMRAPRPASAWNPLRTGRRVAQLAFDPPPGDPPPDAAVPEAAPPDAAAPGAAVPNAAPPDAASPDAAPGDAPAPPAPAAAARGDAAAPPAPAASTTEDGKTEVISVTDTSVEHQLFTGRAPVSVVTRSDLDASGRASLGDILQAIPAQSNAGNAQVNAGGDGTTRINLRGLGASRTLVLLNGRRIVNGGQGADSAVDINAIPLAAIERVEILKDGASALYGADAVGGVVNLISRPQYDGLDVALLTSTSQHGDGTEYDASAVTGFTSNDKHTYLVVSGGYQRHEPVLAGDRGFSSSQKTYDFATRTETPIASLAGPSGRLDATSIGPGGTHPPGCASDVCKPIGGGFADFSPSGDLYNEAAQNYLYTPSSRYNVFATGGNRINDNVALFVELLYQHRDSSRQLSPVAFEADAPISKDSIYNPLGGDILDYRRRVTELGPRQYIDTVTMLRLVLGVTGNLPTALGRLKDWTYEVSYNYGDVKSLLGTTGQLLGPRVADALGPSMIYQGAPICVRVPGDPSTQVIYTIQGRPPLPCVPANILAPAGTIPRDQLNNLTFNDAGNGDDTMRTLLVTTGGKLAELPNRGEISLSLGGDYRYEVGYEVTPSVASVGYTTDNAALPTSGRSTMYEGYSELAIIPITGGEIARHLELDLGARFLHHSAFGSSLTYKAGGLFRTVHGISLRGTYATAFRAPSFPDQFGGRTERMPFVEDPCDTRPPSAGDAGRTLDPMTQTQCAAQGVPIGSRFNTSQQTSAIGGNPGLTAESAATATIGIVIEPPQVKGLAVSADYWHINIDNAIETLGVQTIFANCYDRDIQSYCDQIHRDPATHRITSVDEFWQNVDRTTTSGIDLAVQYDTRLPADRGRLHTALEGQYLIRYDLATPVQVLHGAGYYDLGVYPHYKANLSSRWVHPGGVSAGFNLRYVGGYQECAGDNCNNAQNLATASRNIDRYVKIDLYGGYDFRSSIGRTTLQLGVNNIFDATPPLVYNAPAANSDATAYDFVGRMVYLRLSQLF